MHLTLVGGGWDPEYRQSVYGPFVERVSRRSAEPAVAVVLVDESGESGEVGARFTSVMTSLGGVQTRVVAVPIGGVLDVADLHGCHGLTVGGGLTPAYADALVPVGSQLLGWLVRNDAPYLGFSAGAAIASNHAVVGGWLHGGTPVCPPEAGEDLEEVAVRDGLGLVDFSVDVHANTWQTTGRLQAALSDLPGQCGYAIDEDTALVVTGPPEDALISVVGASRADRYPRTAPTR
ncbi:MAG: Type 1 glutamine amidotransferase-like domain-containing protein [Candidatus Nanopelagicales bacterium]